MQHFLLQFRINEWNVVLSRNCPDSQTLSIFAIIPRDRLRASSCYAFYAICTGQIYSVLCNLLLLLLLLVLLVIPVLSCVLLSLGKRISELPSHFAYMLRCVNVDSGLYIDTPRRSQS